ncbi:PREDICTED: aryl hydrocarbon receptor nuclear translocator-like protein 1 isoform X2 [Vollenhovia emeryi]|uniref:aryl hydrocarbon receptor nuclear translocator-like protein 1 isoform X2 n=1 Tax=Vollenhovia emeryi TaxID=411798 RepID=UPI0005F466F3|nr:PREDICTED: aryl hydrocarbon receptor nuclear translocator-like protein 1 isoform X2 [Vollenhovia emeryi]
MYSMWQQQWQEQLKQEQQEQEQKQQQQQQLQHHHQQQQQMYLNLLPHSQQIHPRMIGADNHASHPQHNHQQQRPAVKETSSARIQRNKAEKTRRDTLNGSIQEIAALVPSITKSSRKLDKISILRLATTFLRTCYTMGDGSLRFLPPMLKTREFDIEQHFVEHLIDGQGFIITVSTTGKIIYVSRHVEQLLGHVQIELLGQSLYNYVYPKDHDELTRNLTPDGMQPMSAATSPSSQVSEVAHDNNSSSSCSDNSSTASHQLSGDGIKNFCEQRRTFRIHIAQRTNSRRDHTQYECFEVSGLLRLAEIYNNPNIYQNRERQRETTCTSNDIFFTGVATLPRMRPMTVLSMVDANKNEYVTRHLTDGRIIYCDHRVSFIAGYLSEEVSGRNAFAYMHKDDFRWTMIGLRQMYDLAETYGSSCYRLLTKNGKFIYLRTHGYLEYHKDSQIVESFVCVNTMVSEEEGIQLIKEMKARLSTSMSTNSRGLIRAADVNSPIEVTSNTQPSNSVEEKSQLEDAITHLISDLPSVDLVPKDSFASSPMSSTQYVKPAVFSPRMSPITKQANKIGVDKKDHCVVIPGKGKVTPKQESKHTIGKLINSSSAEQSPISDSESAMPSGKSLSMFEMMNVAPSHSNVQNGDGPVQSKVLAARKSGKSPRAPRNHTSCLDRVSQNANVLNTQERIGQCNGSMLSPSAMNNGAACNIKVERGIEDTFNCLEKQESMLQYFNDSASDSSIASSRIEMHNPCPLKRISSNENLLMMQSKKRTNDVYALSNATNEQQRISYLKCRSFAAVCPTFSNEFSQYNNDANSQSLSESPNSSLHEIGTDYQHLVDPTAPLVLTNNDEQQFMKLQEDTLLCSEMDANPELCRTVMKIFGGIHNGSADYGNFNEAKMQLLPDDQVVNDGLTRTYCQLKDSMTSQESQINVLTRELENPALRIQKLVRENLSQLQAENNMQKQMLKTLQQDRYKMQVNVNQKLGI